MPSERAAALADEFAAANAAAVAFARSCSEDQWRTVVPGEDQSPWSAARTSSAGSGVIAAGVAMVTWWTSPVKRAGGA